VTTITAIESTDPAVAVGDRAVLDEGGEPLSTADRAGLPDDLVEGLESAVAELRRTGGSTTVDGPTADGSVTCFVDSLDPVPRLLLFGSQNDINPISRLGRDAGFEVVVASARGGQASSEQFPYAHEVVVSHPSDLAEHADEETYAVVTSHNMVDDRIALEALLTGTSVPYVGLMGPRERFEEIREALAEEGTTLTDAHLERVSTPVGLDIGGGEPVQIAISIVSEVLAVHNGRSGGRLKDVEGPVHDRVETPSA
jgi:xanthine dehydrogenase accessory factor